MTLPVFILSQINAPYIEISRLSDIPDPLASVADAILMISYTICVAGFFTHLWANRSSPELGFSTLLRCAIVVACIGFLPTLRELTTTIMYYIPMHLLEQGRDVNGAGDRIRERIADAYSHAPDTSLNFFNMGLSVVASMIVGGFFNLIGLIGSLIVIPFYYLQRIGEVIGFAFMPIALSCMTVPALAGKATNYILSVLAILAWPLGFVLSSVFAATVLDVPPLPATTGLIGSLIVPFLSAGILIVGTTSTPLLTYFVFTTGGGYMPTPSAGSLMSPIAAAKTPMAAVRSALRK